MYGRMLIEKIRETSGDKFTWKVIDSWGFEAKIVGGNNSPSCNQPGEFDG
jgi:hypothetical protein